MTTHLGDLFLMILFSGCFAIADIVHEGFSLPPHDSFDFHTTDPIHTKHLLPGSVGLQPRGFAFFPRVWPMSRLGSVLT